MKIYILRHEDRTQDCSFFSPLTEKGLENSIKLIDLLKKHNISLVFSSPYIRTLQTVYPYVKEKDMTINLEYGLSEYNHQDIVSKSAIGMYLPEYLAKSFLYNPNYKTIITPFDINFPETIPQTVYRTKKCLHNIIEKYRDTEENILLVTHQTICINILNIINKSKNNENKKIPSLLLENYDKGKMSLIYNNGWNFNEIN